MLVTEKGRVDDKKTALLQGGGGGGVRWKDFGRGNCPRFLKRESVSTLLALIVEINCQLRLVFVIVKRFKLTLASYEWYSY